METFAMRPLAVTAAAAFALLFAAGTALAQGVPLAIHAFFN
jgi:hypothetical protein